MKIGELFVSLGVKGADSAKGALKGVKEGLGETKSMALETKAMIAGVVYGLERLMSSSAKAGTGLLNTSNYMGLSAKSLQQWGYAAQQAGISADAVTGSMGNMQKKLFGMFRGEGAPAGLATIQKALAGVGGFDVERASKDAEYAMSRLQAASLRLKPQERNWALESMGMDSSTVAAMSRNAFRPDVLSKAPMYSDREIGQLNKVDVAWGNLGRKIEMAIGHLTAKQGLGIVTQISNMTTEVLKLTTALTNMAQKLKLFEAIGFIFKGLGEAVNLITDQVTSVTNDKEGVWAGVKKTFSSNVEGVSLAARGAMMEAGIIPSMPQGYNQQPQNQTNEQNISIIQNIHGDVNDPAKAKEIHKAAAKAYGAKNTRKQTN